MIVYSLDPDPHIVHCGRFGSFIAGSLPRFLSKALSIDKKVWRQVR
jgi:hypothetical protein